MKQRKHKKLKLIALSLSCIAVFLVASLRITFGPTISGEGLAYLKKFDPDIDLRFYYIERHLGNEKIWIGEDVSLYISGDDYVRIFESNATRTIRYKYRRVLFGKGISKIEILKETNQPNKAAHTMSANASLFHYDDMEFKLNRLGPSTEADIVWL